MFATAVLALSAALPMALSQSLTNETVLGVYMFHRHGDRTAKILGPTNLTALGYNEVYQSGQYYRSRYIDSNAPYRISGINTDLVLESQIQATAPDDNVLQNSAQAFLQALYPPVGPSLDSEVLANGSTVRAPMNGYQLIPIELVESGTGSESSSWLQSSSGCYNAELSSDEYFMSAPYNKLLNSTATFYKDLLPVLSPTYNSTTATFMNAYTIWDFVNVAEIHNSTIPHSNLLTPSTLLQLEGLAFVHEWNLAYNASAPIRSVAGKTLGAEVVQFLNATIGAAGGQTGSKFAVQFGAYGSFQAFFGLADLPSSVSVNFTGVTNYASSMAWEMFTNASSTVTSSNYPSVDDIYVRFLYKNGTATSSSPPEVYPLFGTGQTALKWNEFVSKMSDFVLYDTDSWCVACGNTTGICEGVGSSSSSSSSGSSSSGGSGSGSGNGLSPAINGVIGAFVTLPIVLAVEALLLLVLGLRIVSKKRLAAAPSNAGPKA